MSEEHAGQEPGADDLAALDELLDLDVEPEIPPAGGTEPEPQPQPDEREPPSRQLTREERRVQALRTRLREEEQARKQAQATLQQMLAQTRPQPVAPDPLQTVEARRLEQERIAMMAPHEQAAYYANQTEQRVSQALARNEITTRDMIDRQQFQQLQSQEPAALRLAQQVEDTLAQARQAGMNPTREAVYNLLIGSEVRARMKQQADRQRQRGRAAIARETTRPGGAGSTALPQRRGEKPVEQMSEAELLERIGDQRV